MMGNIMNCFNKLGELYDDAKGIKEIHNDKEMDLVERAYVNQLRELGELEINKFELLIEVSNNKQKLDNYVFKRRKEELEIRDNKPERFSGQVSCCECGISTQWDFPDKVIEYWNDRVNHKNYTDTNDFDNYKLCLKLKELRINNNYTQQQLADMLNVDKSTYASYELGRRHPNIDKLRKLSKFYNLVDELLGVK